MSLERDLGLGRTPMLGTWRFLSKVKIFGSYSCISHDIDLENNSSIEGGWPDDLEYKVDIK